MRLNTTSGYRAFRFDATQLCYSLDSCYDNAASYTSWVSVEEGARVVFYVQSECQGQYVSSNDTSRGSITFTDVGFDKSVPPFTVWSNGIYTNGLMHICQDWESIELFADATSNPNSSSSSSLDVGPSVDTLLSSSMLY